jgi:hypothetical protein
MGMDREGSGPLQYFESALGNGAVHHQLNMKIKSLNSIVRFIVAAAVVFCCNDTVWAVDDTPPLPGSESTLKQVAPHCDLIVVAVLVHLAGRMSHIPGYTIYHDVAFEVKRFLNGKCEKTVNLRLYLSDYAPKEQVKEGDTYIVLCFTPNDGEKTVAKLLPDNNDTERQVIAAMAAGH